MALHLEAVVGEKGVEGSLEHPWPTQLRGWRRFSSPTAQGTDMITAMFGCF